MLGRNKKFQSNNDVIKLFITLPSTILVNENTICHSI